MDKNCNSCKRGFFNNCEQLLKNDEFKTIVDDDFFDSKKYNFKENYICDNYESIYIEYPIEVQKINNNCKLDESNNRVGKFVKIRPCNKQYNNKTYLGIYLGDLPMSTHTTYSKDNKEINISFDKNPAIFVFDICKIIYGCQSWWSIIDSEEELKDITDIDINNVWYVKLLNSLNPDKNV